MRTRSLSDVTWTAEEAPTAAELDRAHAAAGPRRPEPPPGPLTAEPLLEHLAAREAVSAGALEHFADCPVKWLVEDLLKPDELEPDPEAMVRGSYAHEVLQHTYRRLREETGERRVTHANLADAERILLEELRERRSEFRLSPKQTRVRAAARRLEFDLLRYLRSEADSDTRFEPAELELEFGFGEGGEPVEIEGGLRLRGRIDRVDVKDGMALVIDYKTGRSVDRYKVASWEPENRFQAALYMLVVERLLGLRAAGGVYVALASDDPRPRGMVAADVDELGSGYFANDRLNPEDVPREARLGARAHPRDRCPHAQRRDLLASGPLRLERRLQVPLDLQERPVTELTPEQQRAVERRDGSLLVRAGAGTGKTTVLVERFVRAVTDDEVGVESILAITFTEKAAAEMRTRVRRRFLELGRREEARASESAWISTIHGFCSRVLRAHALSAGIDPAFRVLDELESERLAADAFDGALEEFMGDGSDAERIEMVAAYRPDPLRDMVRTAYSHLRSRGERHPRLEETLPPHPAGEHDRLEAAARNALAELAWRRRPPRSRRRSTASRAAPPSRAATRRRSPREACDEYREAFAAHRTLEVAEREHRDHTMLRALLELYGERYERLKRERSALDFEDLELIARDLLAEHEGLREAYSSRFEHVLVDEFQDTNELQNELLELLARGNLFRVGDENQSIYRFRHADVGVFRSHWERAEAEGRAESITVNFRSRGEILDAIDLAFERTWGERFEPLREAPGAREPEPRTSPCVDLLVVDRAKRCWEDLLVPSPTRSGSRCTPRRRGGRPRRGCWRSGSRSSPPRGRGRTATW